jgi:hypothetical protein
LASVMHWLEFQFGVDKSPSLTMSAVSSTFWAY